MRGGDLDLDSPEAFVLVGDFIGPVRGVDKAR